MLTAANCYLLWGITWIQFLTTLSSFSFTGMNLWFYTASGEPFGLTIPETFLVYSIALSVFAAAAVTGATWRVPRLWKRLFAVGLFAAAAIGFSCLNLHLRHYCYARAIEGRAAAFQTYHRNLTLNHGSTDAQVVRYLEWDWILVEKYDAQLLPYREKYGNGPPQ